MPTNSQVRKNQTQKPNPPIHLMMQTMSTTNAAPSMALARAAVLRSDSNSSKTPKDDNDDAPLRLAHHITLGRGGEGRVLPSDDNDTNEATKKEDSTHIYKVNGRVIFDAHARLRRARTRRALAALLEEADDFKRTAGDLELRVRSGAVFGTVLSFKRHDGLRLRLRREALRALTVTHAFKHVVRAPRPEPERRRSI
jgi:hypothetical protein